MPYPHVASILAGHTVAEARQASNQPLSRHAARQFHAASSGMSSSFT